MLVGPYPVDLVIARLETLPELKLVSGAAGLDAALSNPSVTAPAAYVLCNEAGREGDYGGRLAQPIVADVIVVLCVRHAGTANSGSAAAEAMRGIERAVRTSLRTWAPPAPFGTLSVLASGSDQYIAGQLLRQIVFRADYRDQEETP